MGFIESVVEKNFSKDESGKDIYHPKGMFAKGYILDAPTLKEKIKKKSKRIFRVWFALFFLSMVLFSVVNAGVVLLMVFSPVFIIWHESQIKRLLRGLSRPEDEHTFHKRVENRVRKMSFPLLIFGFAGSLLFVFGTIILFVWGNKTGDIFLWIGLAVFLFFSVKSFNILLMRLKMG